MRYMIITDTHFGHYKLLDHGLRHKDADNRILNNCRKIVTPADILIHLGDVCIGNEVQWNDFFNLDISGKHWLCKGNHDRKSDSFYVLHGWDFVGDQIIIKRFGYRILFSHQPQEDGNYFDINIHGHFHNTDYEAKDPVNCAKLCKKHYLVKLEHEYKPFLLKTIVRNWEKGKNGRED